MPYQPKTNTVNRILLDLDDLSTVRAAKKALEDLGADVAQFDAVNARLVAEEIQRLYVDPAVMALKWYPPKRRDSKYKRTYKLRRGWEGLALARGNTVRVLFTNDVHYRRFVQGLIGLGISRSSVQRYAAPIQHYHIETGWRPAAQIIQKYVNEARIYAQQSSQAKASAFANKRLGKLR